MAAHRSKAPRRSTILPGTIRARRSRWFTVGVFDAFIIAFAVWTAALTGVWSYLVSGVLMAAVTITTLLLSETDVRRARGRARAESRIANYRRREVRVAVEHLQRALDLIAEADPQHAASMRAAFTLDLARLYAMTTRLESDADSTDG